jgi:hypothetical protein
LSAALHTGQYRIAGWVGRKADTRTICSAAFNLRFHLLATNFTRKHKYEKQKSGPKDDE